jgi:hypothetical protein
LIIHRELISAVNIKFRYFPLCWFWSGSYIECNEVKRTTSIPAHLATATMNIESKSVSKRGKLTVTVTFSGAELSWLQHLARTELDKGETIAWALGSQMLLARELRDMTRRLDTTFLGTMAVAERDGVDLDPDEILQLIADREKQEAEA